MRRRTSLYGFAVGVVLLMYTAVVLIVSPKVAPAWAGGTPPPSRASLQEAMRAAADDLRRQNDAVSGVDRRLADFAKERRLVEGALEGQRHAVQTAVAGLHGELANAQSANVEEHAAFDDGLRQRGRAGQPGAVGR